MGAVHEEIDATLAAWIAAQHVMFVATAPNDPNATVNLSPKGTAGTIAVLDEHTVAYLDLTGSGIETVAHLRDNGRITLMWCSFEGPPRIVRVHGHGRVVTDDDPAYAVVAARFVDHRGARAIIVVEAHRISDSCGYSVPLLDFVAERDVLDRWTDRRSDDALASYRSTRNAESIDGLPGL